MAKYKGKHSSGGGGKGVVLIVIAILLVLAVLAVGLKMWLDRRGGRDTLPTSEAELEEFVNEQTGGLADDTGFSGDDENTPDTPDVPDEPDEPEVPSIALPYKVDGLEIESISESSLPNPDAEWADGEEIVSIVVKNTSQDYIERAELTLWTASLVGYNFVIEDLPVGGSVLAFNAENSALAADDLVANVEVKSIITAEPHNAAVETEVTGNIVTITNRGSAPTGTLRVVCHSWLGDKGFGGISYSYSVESLGAGESVTVTAADCIFGEAWLVLVEDEG